MKIVSLTLTPLRPEDESDLHEWENDDDARRWNGAWRPIDAMTFHGMFMAIGRDPTMCVMAIRGQAAHGWTDCTPPIIGFVRIAHIHPINRSADIGIVMRFGYRRVGLGYQALCLAIDLAWRNLNLLRLSLNVVEQNTAARALYLKAGFREEGTLQRAVYGNGEWSDLVMMAILRGPDFGT